MRKLQSVATPEEIEAWTAEVTAAGGELQRYVPNPDFLT
jgi:hypothetical protein